MSEVQFARLLLIHPGALGDLVQAAPAVADLRAAAAPGPVALLTGAAFGELARTLGLADEILTFDTDAAWNGTATRRVRALYEAVRRARAFRPTHAVAFKAAAPYALVARLSGARVRVGFTRARAGAADLTTRLLTRAVPLAADVHREDRFAALAAAAGAAPRARPPLPWPPSSLPDALGARRAGETLIGIAPGGARNLKEDMPARRWPAARFAAVARALLDDDPSARVVLLGGASDARERDVVRAALPVDRVVDLVGRTSVLEARAVIAELDVLVTNDSGLLHVAATTDTPIVAVFGPTDPGEAAPRRGTVRVLWSPARAAPCHDAVTGALAACASPCCMERVGVEAVLEAARAAVRLDADISARLVGQPHTSRLR